MHILKLLKNVFSITLIQAVNYLLPIIILPFLIGKVGIINFGLSSYVLTMLMPAKIFIDYGFNLSGVKDIATNKNDMLALEKTVSTIIFSKIYLLVITFFLLVLAMLFVPKLNGFIFLFLLTFLVVIGQSLVPVWFFQGLEETQVLLFFSVITRIVYLILIYILIKKQDDYIFINACLGIADILLSVLCLVYIYKRKKITINPINFQAFRDVLKSNFVLAKTNVFTMLSITMPFTILGFFATEITLGYYSIADKVLQVIRTSAVILYNSAFPRVIILYHLSMKELAVFVKKMEIAILFIYTLIFAICFFFPEQLVKLLIHENTTYQETYTAIKILALIPLIAALDIIPSHLLLITNQYKKYSSILLISCIISITLSVVLIPKYSYKGVAFACLTTEAFTLLMLWFANKKMMYDLCFVK